MAQQRYPNAEAAWQAAWKEGRRLVQIYQAELNQGTWNAGRLAAEKHANADGSAAQADKAEPQSIAPGVHTAHMPILCTGMKWLVAWLSAVQFWCWKVLMWSCICRC